MPEAKRHKNIEQIQELISSERFSKYLEAANQDKNLALDIYLWNISISSAFYGPLNTLEVSLRNAQIRELETIFGPNWSLGLKRTQARNITRLLKDAEETLKNQNKGINSANLASELNFGFWVAITGPGTRGKLTEKVWLRGLHRAFPNPHPKRSQITEKLETMNLLRNRIAHHEAIFHRHLAKDYEVCLEALGWISFEVRDLVINRSRVKRVLNLFPLAEPKPSTLPLL